MKILFVLENYYPHLGGLESVFRDLAEGLVRRGHDVLVVTHRLAGTARRERVGGVEIYRVACFDSRYWFTFLSVPAVLRFARQANIIHTTTYNGAPPAWLAARALGKPVIITVHEVLGHRWRMLYARPIVAWFHRIMERVILGMGYNIIAAVSESTARNARLLGCGNVKTIYNGLDYSFWDVGGKIHERNKIGYGMRKKLGLEEKHVGLFYGRPGVSKGVEVLIHAMPAIIHELPEFHLVAILSRDKAYQQRARQIRALAQELNVMGHITFLGPVPRTELPSYLLMVDEVIVPSLSEGFGFTVAEASAMGCVVVASNIDSISEVVSGKFVLFTPGSPVALAKAVLDAHNEKYQKKPLRKFELEENITSYLNAYQRMLEDDA